MKQLTKMHLLDINDILSEHTKLSPLRKLVFMVLLMTLKDKATELRFEPWISETDGTSLKLSYEIDGQLHELEPPPPQLTNPIIQDVELVAGFQSPGRNLANGLRRLATRLNSQTEWTSQSQFLIKAGDDTAQVLAHLRISGVGDSIVLKLANCPASFSTAADNALQKIFKERNLPPDLG